MRCLALTSKPDTCACLQFSYFNSNRSRLVSCFRISIRTYLVLSPVFTFQSMSIPACPVTVRTFINRLLASSAFQTAHFTQTHTYTTLGSGWKRSVCQHSKPTPTPHVDENNSKQTHRHNNSQHYTSPFLHNFTQPSSVAPQHTAHPTAHNPPQTQLNSLHSCQNSFKTQHNHQLKHPHHHLHPKLQLIAQLLTPTHQHPHLTLKRNPRLNHPPQWPKSSVR